MRTVLLSIVMLTFTTSVASQAAEKHHHPSVSKYAGQESRTIKSLSPDDIAKLKRGGGWGLAKAAELNGVPGPAHLLELKDEIHLSADQISRIEKLYDRMKESAIIHGKRLIALEEKLEEHFRKHTITDVILRDQLGKIAQVREALRYTHLAAHLETPAILSKRQIARYNSLRGYSSPDPCENIPPGHDPKMWRQHNGCR